MSRGITLSIVIPAFNVEKFLGRCLASVCGLDQAVEVIVVDDGSDDATGQIAELAASRAGNMRVIRQQNSGLGAARNLGLSYASGEFVWFIDADDYVQEGAVTRVVETLTKNDPDVLVVDFSCANESASPIEWVPCPFGQDQGRTLTGPEFFAKYHATTYAWLYVMRRGLLQSQALVFQPRINMQDAEFIPRLLAVAGSVHVSGLDAYVYVKREGSFINSVDPEVRERYFQSVLEVRRSLSEFRHGVADALMRDGLDSKLAGIRRILLMAFVYDGLGRDRLRARCGLLREAGVYPFAPIANETVKDGLIRRAVNAAPIVFPRLYAWLRSSAAVRWLLRVGRNSEA